MRTQLPSALLAAAFALAVTLPAAPAQAAARAFVSAAGNDSNPCTITMPCRGLQAAYNAVAANGQIDVLDPGNYGSLTITGPVSIQGHGWAAMSAPTGAVITINANASDKIAISGVVLDGLGIAGTTGIQFNSGGSLAIEESLIRNFTNAGIRFEPTNSSNLYVSKTRVAHNNNGPNIVAWGIYIHPSAASTNVQGVLEGVEMVNNFDGLGVDAANMNGGSFITVTVANSVAGNNVAGGSGMYAFSINAKGNAHLAVRSSTIANNPGYGLLANGINSIISVSKSTFFRNGQGSQAIDGFLFSYGDNDADELSAQPFPLR